MRDQVIYDILQRMFQQFNLPWNELTIQNMREKVNLLHTITKKDIRNMKRIGLKAEEKKDEPVVYKSRLEEMIARKRENSSPGLRKMER